MKPLSNNPSSSTARAASGVSTSMAARLQSPGTIAGSASGCVSHQVLICSMSALRDLNPPETSGALSSPHGKTGQPPAASACATSIIGWPSSPRQLAILSAAMAFSVAGFTGRLGDVVIRPLVVVDVGQDILLAVRHFGHDLIVGLRGRLCLDLDSDFEDVALHFVPHFL